jgi:transcriptional regulator with XRE-family HTH domain
MSMAEHVIQDASVSTLRVLLREHRNAAGLTQAALAEQVGLTGGMISQVELGQRNLSRESVDRVATTLKLTPAERNSFYVAREVAAENLSERKPKGFDVSFAVGLAQIDAELASLGGQDDPDVVDRRIELYDQRDKMTARVRETGEVTLSRRVALAEGEVAELAIRYERVLYRMEILESEVARLSLDNEEAAFREAQRRAAEISARGASPS